MRLNQPSFLASSASCPAMLMLSSRRWEVLTINMPDSSLSPVQGSFEVYRILRNREVSQEQIQRMADEEPISFFLSLNGQNNHGDIVKLGSSLDKSLDIFENAVEHLIPGEFPGFFQHSFQPFLTV